jgi:hypothetical protein
MWDSFLTSIVTIVQILVSSSATATLSIVGLVLLLLAGVLAYWALTSAASETSTFLKASLLACLVTGVIFSAAGPGLALFWVSQSSIKKISAEKAFDSLKTNGEVRWLIRLIMFDPKTDPELSVGRLAKLGPPKQIFSFVANYEELVGYTAKEALRMTGGIFEDGKHISAIIFPRRTQLFPVNARGLLQVVQDVESRKNIDLPQKFLLGSNLLNENELRDLTTPQLSFAIPSYQIENFKDKYQHYCELARRFQCEAQSASEREYLGGLNADWNPLGFSVKEMDVQNDCRQHPNSTTFCTFSDWKTAKEKWLAQFGSRVFLIRNVDIDSISGRILIDFDQPDRQLIPNIGVSRPE